MSPHTPPPDDSNTSGSTDQYHQSMKELAHDLQNPLAIAIQYLKLVRELPKDEYFNEIETALDRIDEIITTEIESMEGDSIDTESTIVELPALIDQAWQTTKTEHATLNDTIQSESPPSIYVNESHLQSLLENLFRNAAEHGGENVTVSIGELSDNPGFYVADDGQGIPRDQRIQVFQPGYSTSSDGTGIGLQVVSEVSATYDWELTVTESENGGARFEFQIPETNWVRPDC